MLSDGGLASVTPLHSLPPVGLGTAAAESLTGYIARLSASHSVDPGTLIMRVVAPQLGRGRVFGADNGDRAYFGAALYRDSRSLNGSGSSASDWVAALNGLTGRDDLEQTTFIGLRRALPRYRLLSAARHYCPTCSAEARASDVPPYDRLLFTLAPVVVCPWHEHRLRAHCWRPECGAELRHLSWRGRPDHCSACGVWLGAVPASTDTAGEYDLWVARQLAAMMDAPHVELPAGAVPAAIASALKVHGWMACELADRAGVGRPQVSTWRNGQATPSLAAVCRVAHAVGTDVLSFLTGEVRLERSPGLVAPVAWHPRLDWKLARRTLRSALRRDPPPSLSEVARTFGHDRRYLANVEPALARQVVARYARWRRAQVDVRRLRVTTAVSLVVQQLADSGRYPSRRLVESLLPARMSLRERAAQEAWVAARDALDAPREATVA